MLLKSPNMFSWFEMCFHLKSNQVSVKQWHCRGILRSRMYRLNLSFFRKHYIIHVIIMALHKCKYTSIRRGEKKSITNIAKNVWMKVTVGRQKGSLKSEGFPMYCMSESFNGNTQNSVLLGGTVSGLLVTYTCPLWITSILNFYFTFSQAHIKKESWEVGGAKLM